MTTEATEQEKRGRILILLARFYLAGIVRGRLLEHKKMKTAERILREARDA